jgi:hypothetical protein
MSRRCHHLRSFATTASGEPHEHDARHTPSETIRDASFIRGISGAKGRDKRPGFDALCKDAVRREFDVVLAW